MNGRKSRTSTRIHIWSYDHWSDGDLYDLLLWVELKLIHLIIYERANNYANTRQSVSDAVRQLKLDDEKFEFSTSPPPTRVEQQFWDQLDDETFVTTKRRRIDRCDGRSCSLKRISYDLFELDDCWQKQIKVFGLLRTLHSLAAVHDRGINEMFLCCGYCSDDCINYVSLNLDIFAVWQSKQLLTSIFRYNCSKKKVCELDWHHFSYTTHSS